jgi:hypothetical protein
MGTPRTAEIASDHQFLRRERHSDIGGVQARQGLVGDIRPHLMPNQVIVPEAKLQNHGGFAQRRYPRRGSGLGVDTLHRGGGVDEEPFCAIEVGAIGNAEVERRAASSPVRFTIGFFKTSTLGMWTIWPSPVRRTTERTLVVSTLPT